MVQARNEKTKTKQKKQMSAPQSKSGQVVDKRALDTTTKPVCAIQGCAYGGNRWHVKNGNEYCAVHAESATFHLTKEEEVVKEKQAKETKSLEKFLQCIDKDGKVSFRDALLESSSLDSKEIERKLSANITDEQRNEILENELQQLTPDQLATDEIKAQLERLKDNLSRCVTVADLVKMTETDLETDKRKLEALEAAERQQRQVQHDMFTIMRRMNAERAQAAADMRGLLPILPLQ